MYTREASPTLYTGIRLSAAGAFALPARAAKRADAYAPSLAAYREAAGFYTREVNPKGWASICISIGGLLMDQAALSQAAERHKALNEARATLADAAPVVVASSNPALKAALASQAERRGLTRQQPLVVSLSKDAPQPVQPCGSTGSA